MLQLLFYLRDLVFYLYFTAHRTIAVAVVLVNAGYENLVLFYFIGVATLAVIDGAQDYHLAVGGLSWGA
jgi:hypothetical protein